MRRFRVATLSLVMTLLVFLSCTDGTRVTELDNAGITAVLQFVPVFSQSALSSAATAKPINRIRVTVETSPAGEQIYQETFQVDPNSNEWQIPVEIPLSSDPTVRYVVSIELINFEGGVEETQFSSRSAPLAVSSGANSAVRQVEVYRGPLENLSVVGLTLAGPASVLEGESFQMTADVQVNDNAAAPTVFWSSLTPTLASIDDNGVALALAPGVARLQAEAGPVSAVHEVEIIGVTAGVEIDPGVITLNRVGDVAEFTATVVDSRGADRGESVTWSIEDERVARNLGEGRFEALSGGETTVTATGVESPDFSTSARLVVDLAPVRLAIRPDQLELTAIGQTGRLEAVGVDALGNDVFGVTAEWSSRDTQVATVDANGRVTAVGPGETTIEATSNDDEVSGGGAAGSSATITAEATVVVRQAVAGLVIDPTEATVMAIGAEARFTATALDSEGNVIADATAEWRSEDESVATVDETGLATSTGRGSTAIVASADGVEGRATFNVEISVASLQVLPTLAFAEPGGTAQFRAQATDDQGAVLTDVAVAWSSSDEGVATVDATGLVTARTTGDVMITAEYAGLTASGRLLVRDAAPVALEFLVEPQLAGYDIVHRPAVQVAAVTADGRVATTYNGQIELGYTRGEPAGGSGPARTPGVELDGTLIRQAVNGVATFDDLEFGVLGVDFIVTAATVLGDLTPTMSATFDVVPAESDLTVNKVVTSAEVAQGGEVTFLVTLQNLGPFAQENIAIEETFGAGWSVGQVTPSRGTWDGTYWNLPLLEAGTSATLTVAGTVTGAAGGTVNNSVCVYAASLPDPDALNDCDSTFRTIAGADIAVTKNHDPESPGPGETVTYTVTAENVGVATATGIVVGDAQPAGVTFTTATPSLGSWDDAYNEWSIPSLAPGASATLVIDATITGAAGDNVQNIASLITLNETDTEGDNDNGVTQLTINTPPVVTPGQIINVDENTPTTLNIAVVDADGDNIVAANVTTGPQHGTAGVPGIPNNTTIQVLYTPENAYTGSDQIQVTVTDEHGAVSAVETIDLNVTAPGPNPFQIAGNIELVAGSYTRPTHVHYDVPEGILEGMPGVVITSTGTMPTAQGGTVDVLADGGFRYRPALGFLGTDQFVVDTDIAGQVTTIIEVIGVEVWTVDNTAPPGGTGQSWSPFNQLAQAESPTSGPGDAILVMTGDGTTTGMDQGFTMQANQQLVGQGWDIDSGTLYFPLAAPPRITNTGGSAFTVDGVVQIAGVTLDSPAGHGIAVTGAANLNLEAVDILNPTGNGIDLNNTPAVVEAVDVDIIGGTIGLNIVDGTPRVDFDGSIRNTSGFLVSTFDQSGGSVDLFGGPYTSNTGAGIFVGDFSGDFFIDQLDVTGAWSAVTLQSVTTVGSVLVDNLHFDGASNAVTATNISGDVTLDFTGTSRNSNNYLFHVDGVGPSGSLTVNGTSAITDEAMGVRLLNVTGGVTVNPPLEISHLGPGFGIDIQNAAPGAMIQFGTVDIEAFSPAPPGGGEDSRWNSPELMLPGQDPAGVYIGSSQGHVTFADLDIETVDRDGIYVSGGATPGTLEIQTGTVFSDLRPAIVANQIVLDVFLTSLISENSPSQGVQFTGVDGTFAAQAGYIETFASVGVSLSNTDGNFDFGTDITSPMGGGRTLFMFGAQGQYDFTGPILEQGQGIQAQNSTNASLFFGGLVEVDVTAGTGIVMDNVGSVEMTNTGNTIVTDGHAGLTFVNTEIGPAGVTFQSIDVEGAFSANHGISISNPVPSAGSFQVLGTGGAGSGGTINGTDGAGVFLSGPTPVSLAAMVLSSNAENGIRGLDTGDVTITNTTIWGNGGASATPESNRGIHLDNPSGTFVLGTSTVENSDDIGIGIVGDDADAHFQISNSSIRNNGLGGTGGGIYVTGGGARVSNLTFDIFDNVIQDHGNGTALLIETTGSQLSDAQIDGNTISNNQAGIEGAAYDGSANTLRIGTMTTNSVGPNAGSGLFLQSNGTAALNFDIAGNTISANAGGILISQNSLVGGQLMGRIANNTIDGTTSNIDGISTDFEGDGTARVLVENNQLMNISDGAFGGLRSYIGFDAGSNNTVDLTVTENTISHPVTSSADGIHIGVSNTGAACVSLNGAGNTLSNAGAGQDIFGGIFSATATLLVQGLGAPTALEADLQALWDGQNIDGDGAGPLAITWTIAGGAQAAPGTCDLPPTLPPFVPN